MKKYFFYAAMAVATMASCTSEDDLTVDPVNPTPDAEEQVALNLGVVTPSMTVGSRGTGMVGSVDGDGSNVTWNSQQLFVTMVNQKNDSVYQEPDGKSYFENITFRAPRIGSSDDLIRMYTKNGYQATTDNGILEYKYYPVTGEYTFYGWHVDDAEGPKTPAFGQSTAANPSTAFAEVQNIIIDGTQDLLAANTIAIPDSLLTGDVFNDKAMGYAGAYKDAVAALYNNGTNPDAATYKTMVEKQFSARTARNNFTPILNFKHTLARLKFHVKAGKGTDAALNYMGKNYNNTEDSLFVRKGYTITLPDAQGNGGNWADAINTDTTKLAGMLNGAIYVTDIKVLDANNNITLNLLDQTATVATEDVGDFTLMSSWAQVKAVNPTATVADTTKLQKLVAVAPSYATNVPTNLLPANYKADEIGESIMFLPVKNATTNEGTDEIVKIQVQLGQCLIKTEDERENANPKYTYYWDTPKPVVLTLKANDIVKPGEDQKWGADGVFEAGKSYDVYITIYGRERIEVSANLVPWTDGGDIETDIEDGYQN